MLTTAGLDPLETDDHIPTFGTLVEPVGALGEASPYLAHVHFP